MIARARLLGRIRATAEATGAVPTGGVVVLAVAVRELARVVEYRTASAVALAKIREVLARPRRPEPAPDAPELPDGPAP